MNFKTDYNGGCQMEVISRKRVYYLFFNFMLKEQTAFFNTLEEKFEDGMYEVRQDQQEHETCVFIKSKLPGGEFMELVNDIFMNNIKP